MTPKLQEVRKAMREFIELWAQGLKDIGLYDDACRCENSLIDLESDIYRVTDGDSSPL